MLPVWQWYIRWTSVIRTSIAHSPDVGDFGPSSAPEAHPVPCMPCGHRELSDSISHTGLPCLPHLALAAHPFLCQRNRQLPLTTGPHAAVLMSNNPIGNASRRILIFFRLRRLHSFDDGSPSRQ